MAEKLSRVAVATRGAVVAYLAPKLATDAKLDVTALVRNATMKMLRDETKRTELAASIVKAAQGKLAKDAVIDTKDLGKIMDVVGMLENGNGEATEDQSAATGLPTGGTGGSTSSSITDLDSGTMDTGTGLTADEEAEYQRLCAKRNGDKAKDEDKAEDEEDKEKAKAEDEEEDKKDEKKGEDQGEVKELPKVGGEKEKAVESKKAMDAAMARAADTTIARLNALEIAKREVVPLVGEVTGQFTSAADVYAEALKARGVALDEMPRSGYGAMVRALVAQRETQRRPVAANDSAAMDARAAFDKAHGLVTRRVRRV